MDSWSIGRGPSAMGICAFCYMWDLSGFNGVACIYGPLAEGFICHGYMCILLYMKLIGCNSFAWIYGQLAQGSICHGYMCILLCMKLTGCNGFAWIYG